MERLVELQAPLVWKTTREPAGLPRRRESERGGQGAGWPGMVCIEQCLLISCTSLSCSSGVEGIAILKGAQNESRA